MWLSWTWLKELVDLDGKAPEEVAAALTMKTALIEGIEHRGAFDEKIVVGRVLERRGHPNADRLSLCVVDAGGGEPLEVVCGAPNVAAGQNVVVALPGGRLPDGTKIGRAKIRGVRSHGMICSERELGLGEDHDGILVLEEGLEPGRPFRELAGVEDVLFEIDNKSVTHRPDLWGHEGFARELSAIFGAELRPLQEFSDLLPGDAGLAVRIEDEERCGRYHALVADGDLGRPSPGWLRRRLVHLGQRPIALAVDLSNYVMLEIGQPTHPFDRDRIAGDRLVVRGSRAGEEIVTLDGERRRLPEGTLVIADAERPVAIAGVVGGEASGIGPGSRRMALESAWFDPVAVRRTGQALQLRTEALARFEKHLDPDLSERAVRRYAALLAEIAPEVAIGREFAALGEARQAPRRLRLDLARLRGRLGLAVEAACAVDILRRLRFEVTERASDALDVVVPSFRATRDVTSEDDLIEEVGRILGYEHVPETLPRVACAPARLEETGATAREFGVVLRERFGFAEALSYPFVPERLLLPFGGADRPHVIVRNPPQADAGRLRRSLLPWLLEFLDRNIRRVEEVRLYECGRVFLPELGRNGQPAEPVHLAGVWGRRSATGDAVELLRRLQGVVESLSERAQRPLRARAVERERPAWAHPGRCADLVCAGRSVGRLAEVHPDVRQGFGWKGPVAAFWLDLTALVEEERAPVAYRPLRRHPEAWFDLSFLLDFSVGFERVVAELERHTPTLDRVELVDEYRGAEGEAAGARSLTVRIWLAAEDRTLTEAEIESARRSAREAVERLGGRVRGGTVPLAPEGGVG